MLLTFARAAWYRFSTSARGRGRPKEGLQRIQRINVTGSWRGEFTRTYDFGYIGLPTDQLL